MRLGVIVNSDKSRLPMSSEISARELAKLITEEHGQGIKASCCGVWTEHKGAPAVALEIDVGGGFVPAVRINGKCHTTILVGPFTLQSRPSYLSTLMLHCDNYFILREPN